MAEPQDTAADRASAGTVADETARLVEALGVWATSVSSSSGTTAPVPSRPQAPPATETQHTPTGSPDDAPQDDPGAHGGAGPDYEPRPEAPDETGRCGHCGARTGVGQTVSCQVCPVCQGIALLRTVRPETVDRLADLAGSVAATLREVAAHVRTRAQDPGPRADGPDGSPAGRAGAAQTGPGGPGAPRGPATVQDIPVGDGDSSDEGDEW